MGKVLVKSGVDFGSTLAPAGAQILDLLKRLAPTYDFDITITSARDGEHSGPLDPHKSGEAFDLRTNDLTGSQKLRLLNDLQAGLYREPRRFYAFLENPDALNEHIHIQRRNATVYGVLDYLAGL